MTESVSTSMTFGALRMPREVVFGPGQRQALGALTRKLGTRALVCTDARLGADPSFAALMDNLRAAGVEPLVYDRTIAELPLENIEEALAVARPGQPDVVVGIGGGSCLDLAKLTAVGLAHEGPLQNFYGEFRVPGPVLPIVAVPTTSGTGSEATPVAVLGDPNRALKVGIASPYLIPHTAICDSELTDTCPSALTANAGADALTHAIEAFSAIRRPVTSELALRHVFVGKNELSDQHALAAIALIGKHLRAAVAPGAGRDARDGMMLGAYSAGIAFGTAGTAAAHALQYPVGALTKTPHGVGVALLLPYVMEFNRPSCIAEYAQVARALGVADGETREDALALKAIDAVAELFHAIGIPRSLAELGLSEDKQTWVAEQSMSAARLVNNNPRLLDAAAAQQIVRAAFAGNRGALRNH